MAKFHRLVAIVLVLTACQPGGAPTSKKATATPHPLAAGSPSPAPSPPVVAAVVSPPPSSPPAATFATAPKLAAPAGQASPFTGVVTIDPSYLVASGAGSLLAHGVVAGVGAVTADGRNLSVGGRIVAAGEGNVVAAAGKLIGDAGGGVVAADPTLLETSTAGNVVAPGAGILANNGAGIVSNHGGGVVSNNGAGRRLLDVSTARTPIPGAGLLVGVLSLRSHKYLSLGTCQGQPVYAVYTNADGAYQLYLPPDEAGNVIVVACSPDRVNDDRLIYNVVAQAKPHDEPIDEDRALAGRYLHFILASRVAQVLASDRNGVDYVVDLFEKEGGIPAAASGPLSAFLYQLHDEGAKYDVTHWANQRDVDDLATHVTDVALSYLDPAVQLTAATNGPYQGPAESAIAAIADSLRQLREATAGKLAATPGFFAGLKLPFRDGCDASVSVQFDVKKSTDPGDYLVTQYLAKNQLNGFYNLNVLYEDLGVQAPSPHGAQAYRIEAASFAILQALVPILLTQPDVLAEIKTYCTRPGFTPAKDPARQPLPVPTCTPQVQASP